MKKIREWLLALSAWINAPPDENDSFGVHLRETWQTLRDLFCGGGGPKMA
jgi:hypothetical protein